MKVDVWVKLALWVIAVMLFCDVTHHIFTAEPALAQRDDPEGIGRYQIAAWAASSGGATHHAGYYVLDTVTGKVADRKAEVHTTAQ